MAINLQSQYVVTPWVAYTPTFTGFGSVSNVAFFSRRVGDTLQIRGKFTSGVTTATEARITLGFNGINSNVTSNNSGLLASGTNSIGAWSRNIASAVVVDKPILIEPNVGYITFGQMDGSLAPLNKALANAILVNTNVCSLYAQIPIDGWY